MRARAVAPMAEQRILNRVEEARGQQQAADRREIETHRIGVELRHVNVDRQRGHRQRQSRRAIGGEPPAGNARLHFVVGGTHVRRIIHGVPSNFARTCGALVFSDSQMSKNALANSASAMAAMNLSRL